MDIKGVIPILMSPFGDDNILDLDGLSSQVEYCIEAGAKAIAAPLVISEYYTLTDFERDAIYQTTVGAVAGRVKVLAGVSGVSIVHAARLAEMATKAGVDGLIATPPTIAKLNDEEAIRYFNEITDASQLPLMIQNAPPPTGGSISDAAMIEILETNRFVFSIKQELHPDTHTIGKTLELTKALNLPVYGGKGGMYLISELLRGSSGTMPATPLTAEIVQICNRFWQGDIAGARRLYESTLPMINIMMLYGPVAGKTFLHLAGVIRTPNVRDYRASLDDYDLKEMQLFLDKREIRDSRK